MAGALNVVPQGTPGRPTLDYNAGLDGLRALSVIAVLMYHAGAISGGWIGVEVFFVLSGYLITALLVLELDGVGRINLVEFWRRRARRLLPGIVVLVGLVAAYGLMIEDSRRSTTVDRDVLGLLTYTSNWVTLSGEGYWTQFGTASPLRHAWSLAVEEQFYLVFPLLSLAILKRRVRMWAVPGLACLALVWQVAASQWWSVNRVYLGTDTRAFGLLAGATVAVLTVGAGADRRRLSTAAADVCALVGLVTLGVSAIVLAEDTAALFAGPFQVVVMASVMLLAAIVHAAPGVASRALGIAPLACVGRWSYGIYLYHWPILLLLEPEVGNSWVLFSIVTAITLPLAWSSYRFIEQPVRRRGVAALGRPAIAWGVAVVVAIASVAAIGSAGDAPPTAEDVAARPAVSVADRPSATSSTVVPATEASTDSTAPASTATVTATSSDTSSTAASSTSTVIGLTDRPPNRPLRVYVVGDSLGQSFEEALAPLAAELDVELFGRSAGACGYDRVRMRYFNGDPQPEVCTEVIDLWPSDVAAFQPDVVLFIYGSWSGWTHEGRVQTQCEPGLAAHVQTLYGRALDDLGSSGAPVYFVAPAIWEGNPEGPGSTPDRFRCVRDGMRSFVDAHAHAAGFVDLLEEFCVGDRCDATVGGAPVRPDGVHITGEAAPAVVVRLLELVVQPPSRGWPDHGAIEPPN